MKKNVGSLDRIARALGAAAMFAAAALAPLHWAWRLGLGVTGLYMAATVLAGTCLGYRLMGLSTCPTSAGR